MESSNQEILVVEDLHKRFSKTEVLSGISFQVQRGEVLGIIGPSGGGKTTLLRCLNGLETTSSGSVGWNLACESSVRKFLLGGMGGGVASDSLRSNTELRRRVGMVFQAFNLWEDRTVIGNLLLAPRIVTKESRRSAEERAFDLLEQFGLRSKKDKRISTLSGGERQRIAILRALMMKPQALLLDEVTSALDPLLTVEVMKTVTALAASHLTILIVTHHLEFASRLCHRIMFLQQGKIVQIANPHDLRQNPADDSVRLFLEVLSDAR